jgi:hypothetical protein
MKHGLDFYKPHPLFVFCLLIPFLLLSLPLTGAESTENTTPKASPTEEKKPNPYANAEMTTKIIPSANNTFGYDILVYGRPLVHQPTIPGLSGNEGFTTKERAQKVAEFVVKKIRNNEMPPTVTIEDLNGMGVLK